MKTSALTPARIDITVATETWIATALLHREHPERADFAVTEIVARAEAEHMTSSLRPGVQVHASAHMVANRPPSPAQHRMLYAPTRKTRRLYRQDDAFDPRRKGRTVPEAKSMPEKYRGLLDWYHSEFDRPAPGEWLRGVFQMASAGNAIYAGVNGDDYVRQLREGWN